MQIKLVAEGVEIRASWDILANLGCDLIQGYYVSKPLPAAQFAAWVHARSAKTQTPHQEGRGALARVRIA